MIPIAKPDIGDEEKKAVMDVLDSGMLAHGEWVRRFEKEFAGYVGTEYAIATTSGTQALILALEALEVRGKEVIVPSFTFIASATSIIRAGGIPVFADVNPETFNIDPEDVERKIGKRTKAIMPVHLYGQSADMDSIMEIAETHNLHVIEDACQAHGALWKGRKLGSIGDVGAFSFYPTKNMTTGEGGMVTSNDENIAERVRMLHDHGQVERYRHRELGWNFRMTNIAAAIGLEQLKKLENNNEMRRKNAKFYDDSLENMVEIPQVDPRAKHVYHQYTIKTEKRDKIIEEFRKTKIGFGIYYPMGIHQQEVMKNLGHRARLEVTERLVNEVLSVPVHPLLTEKDMEIVVETIKKAVT